MNQPNGKYALVGKVDDVVERVQNELPGLRMLLQHADKQQTKRRGKPEKGKLISRNCF